MSRTLHTPEKWGFPPVSVSSLVYDSRLVTDGAMFVCLVGAKHDSHENIPQAIEEGATSIVVQTGVPLPCDISPNISVIATSDTRYALALLSAEWFGNPAEKLTLIGITGTKGKTTTAYMVQHILIAAGLKTGLIGTVEIDTGNERVPADNTTPESFVIHRYLSEMVQAGCTHAIMEVSSQGLKYSRVAGMEFDIGVFTNLTPDHIGENEHTDLADYAGSKAMLFRRCKVGVFNADDENTPYMAQDASCEKVFYGVDSGQGLYLASNLTHFLDAGKACMGFDYSESNGELVHMSVSMPGTFSVYNAMAAIAVCRTLNIDLTIIKSILSDINVRGRAQRADISPEYVILVDYAHNTVSLKSLLTTLRLYNPKRLVCLFGCGGNRAKERRYGMGEVAARYADFCIVTSDNPRFEEPQDIIDDILVGVRRGPSEYVAIAERDRAIAYAVKNAMPGDIVVIAGKGHEDYQEIKGVKYHMDDIELVRKAAESL